MAQLMLGALGHHQSRASRSRTFLGALLSALLLATSLVLAVARPATALTSPLSGIAATPDRGGYWLVAKDGGVYPFGNAPYFGSASGTPLNGQVVGIASTPSGLGYWLAASDGGVFAFGDAQFKGSAAGLALAKPIVGIAATPSGGGYWLVASDGGVFAFGDAGFHGSMVGQFMNAPVVGMAATPSGAGYWLVGSDGGIFAFGNAGFYGSPGGTPLNKPIVGMARTSNGAGYWLVASDGGIFAYGNAGFFGNTVSLNTSGIVGIAPGPGDQGYWLDASDGRVFAFGGGTPFRGSMVNGEPQAGNGSPAASTLRTAIVNEANARVGYDTPVEDRHVFTPNGQLVTRPWSVDFATSVWTKAGVTDWRWVSSVANVRTQAESLSRFKVRGGAYAPQPGDIAVWRDDVKGVSHVNVVHAVRADGWIATIGGNEGGPNDTVVKTGYYNPLTAFKGSLQGYASPVRPDGGARVAPTSLVVYGSETVTDSGFQPDLTVGNTTVGEAAGSTSFTVSLAPDVSYAVTASYNTANGTAQAPSDYTSRSGSLTFAAGETSKAVSVPVVADSVYEGNETFSLVVSSVNGANGLDLVGDATIVDDDTMPTITIGDVLVREGDSGTRSAYFPVTLSTASGRTTSFSFATSAGTASATTDFTTRTGTQSISAGSLGTVVEVPIVGDTSIEGTETFTMTISGVSGATVGRGTGTGTISDDDLGIGTRVSVGDSTVVEGASGIRYATFSITLSGATLSATTVPYETQAGSATPGSDYAHVSGSVTIPAGSTTAIVQVPIYGDTVLEGAETFSLALTPPSNGVLVDKASGTGRILNDD